MVMLAALGFLMAALLALFIAPLYRKRIARLTTRTLKASMPVTESEIRADKDRLRAEFAIRIHKLQSKLDEAADASARQMVELNRRDAIISELEGEVAAQGASLEEHENARRVLEQTILDRLPKVEGRLSEARKLLFQRDREIVTLTQSSEKQARALEEATQINAQQSDEVHRLKAALSTRAARSREGFADPRYDGEVALRTEIEALRAKAREQSALVAKLQSQLAKAEAAGSARAEGSDAGAGTGAASAEPVRPAKVIGRNGSSMRASDETPIDKLDVQAQSEMRRLKAVNQDQAAEISRLKAALVTYEASDQDDRGVKESKIAMKARLSAVSALTEEQATTIQVLRAEIASSNEKLARQAAYFMEEMRRLGSVPTTPRTRGAESAEALKRPLAERINDPRVARLVRAAGEAEPAASLPPAPSAAAQPSNANGEGAAAEPKRGGFLKALDAAGQEAPIEHVSDVAADGDIQRPRKARLLDRITGLDKNSA